MEELVGRLPGQTRWAAAGAVLAQLDFAQGQLDEQEGRLRDLLRESAGMRRLKTLPGVGLILSAVIALEVGDVGRFPTPGHLASYAGTTPRVASSGGRTRYGKLRDDVNRHLKWALVEAANVVAMNHRRWPGRPAAGLYGRLRERKGHAKAVGAVARHLAEAAWHVLSREEDYRDPNQRRRQQQQQQGRPSRG